LKNSVNGLNARQLAMMALGTVVGGSFFLGSAAAIHAAGPAVIVSYVLGGTIVFVILYALSELTVADPAPGSFRTYAEREFGRGAGFVVGWVYWTGLILAMSSEAMAVAIFMHPWFPGLSLGLIGSAVIIAVTLLNLLGAERLSKLESGLAAVKLLAIAGFIVLGLLLISGLINANQTGTGELLAEPLFPGGIGGIAGSMLIVMFAYAGFETIGLAASEARDPHKTIPRAITYTVISLVGLYVISIGVLLALIPTASLTTETSPFVAALNRQNLAWAGNAINIVLVTAILSTMLAAMFGLGRMIRSLAEENHAPSWLKDAGDIPKRGILFSGVSMLLGLGLGSLLPQQVYLFLVSSGGFALLTTYAVIVATHYQFRKRNGCPPNGNCQLPLYPFSSWFGLTGLLFALASMPLIPGQGSGLAAGLALIVLYSAIFVIKERFSTKKNSKGTVDQGAGGKFLRTRSLEPQVEISEELAKCPDSKKKEDHSSSSAGHHPQRAQRDKEDTEG
jgi:AAT family amino acid transporter